MGSIDFSTVPAAWTTPELLAAVAALPSDATSPAALPPPSLRWRALAGVAPADVRVVVLGQDPYHTPGKANGLAFGLDPDWAAETAYYPHSSFSNILLELGREHWVLPGAHWDLAHLPAQGVLLLNTALTAAPGEPGSYLKAWKPVVKAILAQLTQDRVVVWLAWGAKAARLAYEHATDYHAVLASTHPCRYSATRDGLAGLPPFRGSRCFKWCNTILREHGQAPVSWAGPAKEIV